MRITHQHGQTVDQLDSASDPIGLSFRSTGSLFPDGWLTSRAESWLRHVVVLIRLRTSLLRQPLNSSRFIAAYLNCK